MPEDKGWLKEVCEDAIIRNELADIAIYGTKEQIRAAIRSAVKLGWELRYLSPEGE